MDNFSGDDRVRTNELAHVKRYANNYSYDNVIAMEWELGSILLQGIYLFV